MAAKLKRGKKLTILHEDTSRDVLYAKYYSNSKFWAVLLTDTKPRRAEKLILVNKKNITKQ